MPKTLSDAFRTLRSNLEITDLQTTTVSARQNNIRDAVKADLDIKETFLAGSYSRSTLIAPLAEADIDIFVVLNAEYFHHYNGKNGGPAGLLDCLRRVLKKTYPRTPDISRNGQAVTIEFTDFKVDVVPSFYRQGGGFLIPNSISQFWIPTDPRKHIEITSASNKAHNGDLIPLIKMIKGWNKVNGSHFQSFHLETMALHILNNVRISDFPSGIRFFFDKAKSFVSQKNPDPAGFTDDVGSYINTQDKVSTAVSKFTAAFNTALKAESQAINGYTESSFVEWGKIFGKYFPAYW